MVSYSVTFFYSKPHVKIVQMINIIRQHHAFMVDLFIWLSKHFLVELSMILTTKTISFILPGPQRRDRRVGPRRGRVHRAVRLRWDQRQPDGDADHDQRVQDRLGVARHRCDTLLPVRPPGQERQGRCAFVLLRRPEDTWLCFLVVSPLPFLLLFFLSSLYTLMFLLHRARFNVVVMIVRGFSYRFDFCSVFDFC